MSHFGVVSDDVRALVEEHLLGCTACVRAFIELKRAIETTEDAPRPSTSARARLRSAVATELGVRTAPAVAPKRRPWERPLAFANAAAHLVCEQRTIANPTVAFAVALD